MLLNILLILVIVLVAGILCQGEKKGEPNKEKSVNYQTEASEGNQSPEEKLEKSKAGSQSSPSKLTEKEKQVSLKRLGNEASGRGADS